MGILGAAVIGAAIALKFNRKIEETIGISAILISFIIYIPGLFLSLTPGYIISMILIGVSLIYCVYMIIKDRALVRDLLCTWGGLAFLIYLVFFAYYAYHRDFSHPDELYCWGLMAKNYYLYNDLNSSLSTAVSDQTPLMPIWNWFCAKNWIAFSDTVCYFGQDMFVISIMLPVFARIKRKITPAEFFVIIAMLPSLLVLSGMEGFNYILTDVVLAAVLCMFVYQAVLYILTDDSFHFVVSCGMIIAMCLTKRAGVLTASLAVLAVSTAYLYKSFRKLTELCIYAGIAVITVLSWCGFIAYVILPPAALIGAVMLHVIMHRVELTDIKYHSAIRMILAIVCAGALGIFMLIFLARSGYAYDVLARFMRDLFAVSLSDPERYGYIRLSYGIFILAACILGVYLKSRNEEVMTMQVVSGIVMAMILYAVAMLYTHIDSVGPMNDYRESIIPRYMIPWEILVVFLIICVFVIERETLDLKYLLIGFVILLLISDSGSLYGGLFAKHRNIGYTAITDGGETYKAGDMIYFIDELNPEGYSDREFYYSVCPAKTNFIYDVIKGTNGVVDVDVEEFEAQMLGRSEFLPEYYATMLGIQFYDYDYDSYDYVYLQSYADDFVDRLGSLFENPDDIAPGSAYYVIPDGDHVVLRKIQHK